MVLDQDREITDHRTIAYDKILYCFVWLEFGFDMISSNSVLMWKRKILEKELCRLSHSEQIGALSYYTETFKWTMKQENRNII